MAYIETKEGSKRGSKIVYSGSNPNKSLWDKTGYTKIKQSDGFFDMLVKKGAKAYKSLMEN